MQLKPETRGQGCPRSYLESILRLVRERKVSRRDFTRWLGFASLAALTGAAMAPARRFSPSKTPSPAATAVAEIGELRIGDSKLFRYPTENDPCILIRLGAERYVALSQSCTHLKCPVHFNAAKRQLVCPCHEGFFSAEDGRVLAGPPPRPLLRYAVEIRDGHVWVFPSTPEAKRLGGRSADLQSAVSPICNRQRVEEFPLAGSDQGPAECNSARQPISYNSV